jgi:hypothetical protein
MPGGRQPSSLGLAISNDHAYNQARVIERCTKRVGEAVAQLATFMNRPRNLRSAVAPELARKRKDAKQFEQTSLVLALFRIISEYVPSR